MTAYVGFHTGPSGNARGLGDYFKALDDAGIPAVQKAVDDYGACHELAALARASGIDHHLVFRLSTAGQNDGRDYDVPNYDIEPSQAANNHWQMTIAKLPPEFDKSRVWLEVINEVDKNRSNWLGRFGARIAELALQQGYRVALFGFSSGEPEPEHWREPGMLDFLHMAADHPKRIAVALHEYSLNKGALQDADRWWIGRYRELYAACDERGIAHPTVFITEFGWTLDWVPSTATGMPQIHWANSTYYGPDRIPTALWYLGGGFGDIANKAQPYIQPVTNWALAEGPPDNPPPPPTGSLEYYLWSESLAAQTIMLNPQAALQQAIFSIDYVPVGSEVYVEFDGVQYVIQPAESLTGAPRLVAYVVAGQWDNVQWLDEPDDQPPPPPPPTKTFDLADYMRGDGRQYEVRHANGSQETFQTQHKGSYYFYQVKNQQWEELYLGNEYIWRGLDTSPGPAPDYAERPGKPRYYRQYNWGESMARWCPRHMQLGQSWSSTMPHIVQFYYKSDCKESGANSGSGLYNSATLVAHHEVYVTDQGGVVEDVIELSANGERFYFGRGWGLVAWGHPESESGTKASGYTGELHSGRPDLVREAGCFS